MGCLKGFPNDQGQALPVPKFVFTTEAPGPQRRDDGRSARPSVAAVGAGWSPRGDAVEKMVGLGRAFWKDGSTNLFPTFWWINFFMEKMWVWEHLSIYGFFVDPSFRTFRKDYVM